MSATHRAQARVRELVEANQAMTLTVPDGCSGGSTVEYQDASGTTQTVVVPEGLSASDTFVVHAPVPAWVEEVLDALTHDIFSKVVNDFVAKECQLFMVIGDGHTLAQTEVHQKYKRLYESRIESHLKRHGLTQEKFMQALLTLPDTCSERALVTSLLMVEDFEAFSRMMQQRALEHE